MVPAKKDVPSNPSTEDESKKETKKPSQKIISASDFETSMTKLAKSAVSPDASLRESARKTLGLLVEYILIRLCERINQLLSRTNKKTLTSREVLDASHLIFHEDLSEHIKKQMFQHIGNFFQSINSGEKSSKPIPYNVRAGLTVSTSRIGAYVMKNCIVSRRSERAVIAAASVVETVMHEVIEYSYHQVKDARKVKMTPKNINDAINGISELNLFFKDCFILGCKELYHPPLKEE